MNDKQSKTAPPGSRASGKKAAGTPGEADTAAGTRPSHREIREDGQTGERDIPPSRARARIAQAGQRIMDEARRSVGRDAPPRKKRQVREPAVLPPSLADGLSPQERSILVEALDLQGRPLVCLPLEQALRRGLRLKAVAIALKTRRDMLVLRKRAQITWGDAGRWDLFIGFALVGEALEDAALRTLQDAAGLARLDVETTGNSLRRDESGTTIELYRAALPAGLYPAVPDMLELDVDELGGLVRDAPELLTPELVWAFGTGALFGRRA